MILAEILTDIAGADRPLLFACMFMVLVAALTLARAFRGPTVWDRVLAMNAAGTVTVVIVCLVCFMPGRPDFLDMALAYAVLNFIATVAILKFIRHKRLG